jgi:hypothetical protein
MIHISQTITDLRVVRSLYRQVNLIFCIPKWDIYNIIQVYRHFHLYVIKYQELFILSQLIFKSSTVIRFCNTDLARNNLKTGLHNILQIHCQNFLQYRLFDSEN